jgi:hypothetical protein
MQRDQLRAQNAHVQQVVQQEALRELPVIIGFRKPLFGAGKTAEITNVAGVGMAVGSRSRTTGTSPKCGSCRNVWVWTIYPPMTEHLHLPGGLPLAADTSTRGLLLA